MALTIEYLDNRIPVYDITVADNHNFYANGIVAHNCTEITEATVPMGTIATREFTVTDGSIVSYLADSAAAGVSTKYLRETTEGVVFEETEDISAIALCTLSAINWGNIKKPSDFARPCELAVRALEEILDYQSYPLAAAEKSTRDFRHLGIGIVNFAYWLAKRDLSYTNASCLPVVDEYMEAMSYYTIKASADLAAERGACGRNADTKLGNGILPLDTYKRDVDDLVTRTPSMPWEDLRAQLRRTGIRHATHLTIMPAECQSKDNKILLADGTVNSLGNLLEISGVDTRYYEENQIIGARINIRPIDLPTGQALQAYYNGPQEVYEINIEGETYKFTENHLLLVKTDIGEEFVRVDCLTENMEIISI